MQEVEQGFDRLGHFFQIVFFSEQREADVTPPAADGAVVAVSDDVAARRRTHRHRLIGGLTVLLSLLVAEPVWAAPVVATTAWRGGGLAFALLVPVYFALGYIASRMVIRRAKGTASGWLERWLSGGADRRYLQGVRRLVQAGTVIGFVLSSMLFGAIITTWLLLQLGRNRHIRRDAAVSSFIFSVGFVGFYAGIASLIF